MSKPLSPGLYELLVTAGLEESLAGLDQALRAERGDLHPAEAADRLALHLGRALTRTIEAIDDRSRAAMGIDLVRRLLEHLGTLHEAAGVDSDLPVATRPILRAILGRRPDGTPETIEPPLIPLLDTALLTNAPGEPRVGRQVLAEIASASRIDLLMAFIRFSGIRPLRDALRRHVGAGRPLRVLTTTYTGSTEARALEVLSDLGADVRVSYDTSTTRLHAKAWLFHRDSGFSTAYVGSSNLTHSAQVDGLEWNVRLAAARNPDVMRKIAAVFDTYWQSGEFSAYDAKEFARRASPPGSEGPRILLSPVEIRPEPFQDRLLEQLAVSRARGHHRNLLAAATGTGKTVMAALDYARLRSQLPRSRLLFVAHRQEILNQSQATFRYALRDASFGEAWVAGRRPQRFDHVFASVQSLQRADLDHLPPDHFDVVIVDEFHHAAARSYESLLRHLTPRELLGLTATPERSDGLPVLQWFDGRIAAELRLWDAIDQHFLTPFTYFGVHDGFDLTEVPWRRGRGYDVEGLTNLYTASDAAARRAIAALRDRTDDVARIRALGFCVSVRHAHFMARVFQEHGIPAVAVDGSTPEQERQAALRDLASGALKVVFSVDLFNEGVDVPAVDTLLLLRPTDSPTLFLQQLGRGLRRARGKAVCTVLDFVGHHRREFRFDRRLRALLGGTRRDVERQVEQGFPFLPAGCHMELDPVAAGEVLRSIRQSVPDRWPHKVAELQALVASGREPTLAGYLDHSGLELEDVYQGSRSWSDLLAGAGVAAAPAGPEETSLRRAIGRLLHVDDEVRLAGIGRLLAGERPPATGHLPEHDRRLARMLVASLGSRILRKSTTLDQGLELLWRHAQVRAELRELFRVLEDRIDHVHHPLAGRSDVPLRVHARYTRLEMLAAFGDGDGARVAAWQTGVRWLPAARADLLAFTLDKTGGTFSPTTRYRDYAISRELIHWESQSVTREDSATGRRYREHARRGSDVMLFARLRQSDRAFWFLGPARYVQHEGERPMAVVWRLETPLPGDLFAQFAAAVA